MSAASLGSAEFRRRYALKYACLSGAMYKGIASERLVVAMSRAGMLGFFGTGGLDCERVDAAITTIQAQLRSEQPYGMNLLFDAQESGREERLVDLYLARDVRYLEASAFMRVTRSLVKWRLAGLQRSPDGRVHRPRHTLVKLSKPELAAEFMRPAPESVIDELLRADQITDQEAALGRLIPVADEICVEADSGGHTDRGVAYALIPTVTRLRDEAMATYMYDLPIQVGAAGGIGTPEAAAAALILGADFIVTGSINQCTVEAGTSDSVKNILQELGPEDTDMAPASDMFEIGAKVQVARKGLFFPARANRLYELYRQHDAIEQIEPRTKLQIQDKYLQCSFDEAWQQAKAYYEQKHPERIEAIEANPKQKMALIFRTYFARSTHVALTGDESQRVDYQIHCGPALGAFNHWVKGTHLEDWRNRRVAEVAVMLMDSAAELLQSRLEAMSPARGLRVVA